ncbi:extracellular matrix protein 1 isoform X2 [Dicentrarchus labrax]|uniref:extracellular matrix protein 1 isoform X2 n=1 Tax=Dicentrarchus labrax TaxID=13489 RepID=UPI0021F622BC|nr:extracellular matrix protein 1 isoform X2 [Dicentrarchus labrax]
MGSSPALVCATAFVLVLLSSAHEDEQNLEQPDVTFDLDKIMLETQNKESFMMQRPLDMSELLDPMEFHLQHIVDPPEPYDERGRPSFSPRSFGGPPMLDYPVQFPLAQPSSDNLQAICLYGDRRPYYSDSYFPVSGFGQLKRRASAVNNAESWFSMCCRGNETWGREVTLCCARQAWELSVESFCTEDSSVKDRLYDCCRKTGNKRLTCFHNDAPNPNYGPTEELPVPPPPSFDSFNFDPNTCQSTAITPHEVRGRSQRKIKKLSTSQKIDINFPPGRPTADGIESLCNNQKLRTLYTVKCLPGSGYELLARQAKTINRIEKGFKQCCKKKQDVLNCVDQKWRLELNNFCSGKNGEKVDFHCCSAGNDANGRFDCFQSISPDPYYNMTSATEELSLNKICDTDKIIKKRFPVGFPIKNFVTQCCPLPEIEKTNCFVQTLNEMSENLCLSKKASPPAVRRCCSAQEAPKCISKILMDAVTKATNALRQKKKKRCPLS